MVICLDFDGTLCEFNYPGIGKPKQDVLDKAIEATQKGHILILWTCRDNDHYLSKAINWCRKQGLLFDYINEQSHLFRLSYGNPRKVNADLYVDDKALGSIEYFLRMEL